MFKRLYYFIAKDIALATRDQIMLYMIIAPLMLSFIVGLFLPSLENTKVTFALSPAIEEHIARELERFGQVKLCKTEALVRERVLDVDDAIGITITDDQYTVLLEGNEMEALRVLAGQVIDQIVYDQYLAKYTFESLGHKESELKHLILAALILTGTLIGGVIGAFNIIEEKESRSLRALGVSPLRFGEYMLGRGLIAFIFGLILGIGSTFILVGTDVNLGLLVVGIGASTFLAMLVSFIIGGLADSQITAIAILKVVFLFFAWVPIGSMLLPERWVWIAYPFPNYWAFEAFKALLAKPVITQHFWLSTGLCFILSLVAIVGLTPFIKKKLSLR